MLASSFTLSRRGRPSRNGKRKTAPGTYRRLVLEALEDRTLLSASPIGGEFRAKVCSVLIILPNAYVDVAVQEKLGKGLFVIGTPARETIRVRCHQQAEPLGGC